MIKKNSLLVWVIGEKTTIVSEIPCQVDFQRSSIPLCYAIALPWGSIKSYSHSHPHEKVVRLSKTENGFLFITFRTPSPRSLILWVARCPSYSEPSMVEYSKKAIKIVDDDDWLWMCCRRNGLYREYQTVELNFERVRPDLLLLILQIYEEEECVWEISCYLHYRDGTYYTRHGIDDGEERGSRALTLAVPASDFFKCLDGGAGARRVDMTVESGKPLMMCDSNRLWTRFYLNTTVAK